MGPEDSTKCCVPGTYGMQHSLAWHHHNPADVLHSCNKSMTLCVLLVAPCQEGFVEAHQWLQTHPGWQTHMSPRQNRRSHFTRTLDPLCGTGHKSHCWKQVRSTTPRQQQKRLWNQHPATSSPGTHQQPLLQPPQAACVLTARQAKKAVVNVRAPYSTATPLLTSYVVTYIRIPRCRSTPCSAHEQHCNCMRAPLAVHMSSAGCTMQQSSHRYFAT